MNSKFGEFTRCEILSLVPVYILSRHSTLSPRSSRRSHRWVPRKPAPPVTRTRRLGNGSVLVGLAASPDALLSLNFSIPHSSACAYPLAPCNAHVEPAGSPGRVDLESYPPFAYPCPVGS